MLNEDTNETILALRPGRREMGVAVLEGKDLLFWGVAGFREYQGEALLAAVEARLLALLQTYQPQVLAMEKPSPGRLVASPALGAVMSRISAVAVRAGLQVRLYGSKGVRERLCGDSRATHNQVVDRVVALYPHLGRCRRPRRTWQEDYWRPMFTAVAVGVVGGREVAPTAVR